MKANELMIGDWVREKGSKLPPLRYTGEILHFKPIKGEPYIRLRCMWNKTEGLDISETYIEPIPLTEEILEKNGFTRFGPDYILKGEHFGLENPSIPSNYLDNYWLRISIKAVHIEYVHELQHALRLCGIDKEIVL